MAFTSALRASVHILAMSSAIASRSVAIASGGATCSVKENSEHDVQYGIEFIFPTKGECNHGGKCNVVKFLGETVKNMISHYPGEGEQRGTCSCYVRDSPSEDASDTSFLMAFATNGGLTCDGSTCWNRYVMAMQLAKTAELDLKKVSQTMMLGSANHWVAECQSDSIGVKTSLPSIGDVITQLRDSGKTQAVADVKKIVMETKNPTKEQIVEQDTLEMQQKPVVIVDVAEDTGLATHAVTEFVDTSKHQQNKPILRDLVVLSPGQGTCSDQAAKYAVSPGLSCGQMKHEDCMTIMFKLPGNALNDEIKSISSATSTEYDTSPAGCSGRRMFKMDKMSDINAITWSTSTNERPANEGEVLLCGCYSVVDSSK